MLFDIRWRREAGRNMPVLVWQWPAPMRTIASGPHNGGIGLRRWVINAQVPPAYARRDPDHHLSKLGVSLGLPGRGVGMLTAAAVEHFRSAAESGAEVVATVGLGRPILAAAPDARGPAPLAGTINIVALVPERLSDAALVNAVMTVTEAKVQALRDAGVPGTGTATDAVCLVCPDDGPTADYAGPRSRWGSRLARAVHRAVLTGVTP